MIRRNPYGDIPVIHETAFVDPSAILCGKVVVEESVAQANYELVKGRQRIRNEF
jgi:carbonic anhydrase/acetyltransferase-like protein (isoleucine patch superfamily)